MNKPTQIDVEKAKLRCFITIFIGYFCLLPLCLWAQTNAPPVDPGSDALPGTVAEFWRYGISAFTPILVWAVDKVAPKIPRVLLPSITPFIGIGLGLLTNKLGSTHYGWVDMSQAGLAAVGIREIINQAVTKQLKGTSS